MLFSTCSCRHFAIRGRFETQFKEHQFFLNLVHNELYDRTCCTTALRPLVLSWLIPFSEKGKREKKRFSGGDTFPGTHCIGIVYSFFQTSTLGANRKMFGLRTIFSTKLHQDLSKHRIRTTQHGGREGEQEQVTMC
jgi:hypothetical protein